MNEAKFAGACIIKDGKILLVQESHSEAYGLWSFPLGHVDNNESEDQAAVRETKEETGYDVSLGNFKIITVDGKDFKSIKDFDNSLIKLYIFEAEIIGGELKAGDGILDAKWFPLNSLHNLPLRGEWIGTFLKELGFIF